jgi:hypothetical protein
MNYRRTIIMAVKRGEKRPLVVEKNREREQKELLERVPDRKREHKENMLDDRNNKGYQKKSVQWSSGAEHYSWKRRGASQRRRKDEMILTRRTE